MAHAAPTDEEPPMRFAGRRPRPARSSLPLLGVLSVLVALLSPVSALASGGYPTASLSLPGGLTVSGTIAVDAAGAVNPAGSDTVKTLALYADGAAAGSTYSCPGGQKACTATLSWDGTGLSGAHALSVRVVSASGATVTSAATIVTVTSPAPTAVVESPTSGSQVAGFVSVTGSGAVDPSQTDTAQTLQFYVDGKYSSQKSCPGSDPGCTETFAWDTTSLYGLHTLQVRLRTGNGVLAMSPAVSVQVGDPPAAHVSSPAAGSSVTGLVTVTGGGTVDGLQPDTAGSLQLLVDGVATSTVTCSGADSASCSGRFSWDSTGAAGQHQLRLKLLTAHGQSALSPIVVVTANNPAPSVVLTTAATVSGVVQVKLRGTVDASQTDAGALVRLLADGRSVGTATCPVASKSCVVSVSWNTKGLVGQHLLQAQFTTTGGRTVSSPVSQVWVFSAVKVSLTKPADVIVGRTGTIAGRVTAADGSAVAGAEVRVVVQSSLGQAAASRTVTTGPTGAFSASYKAISNSSVTAGVLTSAHYGAASATARVTVMAAPSCTMRTAVAHGVADPVVCRLGYVTRGTTITLQSRVADRWRTLTSTRSTGGTWSVGQVFPTKGTVWVRVSVAASKDFGAAVSEPVKVAVR